MSVRTQFDKMQYDILKICDMLQSHWIFLSLGVPVLPFIAKIVHVYYIKLDWIYIFSIFSVSPFRLWVHLSLLNRLSGGFWAGQAQSTVVKMKFLDFSYWASSKPWGHIFSLKTLRRNPVLSWAIRYSVFQKVKFTSSLEFMCDNPFSTFWHLMVKFG